MSATVQRHRAPSGNTDADYFQAGCSACGWQSKALHSNRTVEGRTLAERDAEDHNRARHRDSHQLLEMPDRFYCACGYGYDGPKRTVRGLRTHILRSNSSDAGSRARANR